MEEMYVYKNQKKLRWGYTTGTCGTAASMAAALMLLVQKRVGQVKVSTPKGLDLDLEIEEIRFTKEQAVCAVRKDSGDDPDVTNGIAIYSRVSFRDDKPETEGYIWENEVIRLHLTAGEGVGIVTKPGLACEVGKPAINPVPREMIFTHVERACRQYGFQGSLHIEIFIPQGIEISKKTFNPCMGIKGGISLLGTSGMVEPMSEKALIDSIRVEMTQHAAMGEQYMLVTPGNYGADYLREHMELPFEKNIKCSNYVGETIDMAVDMGVKGILFISHIGKFVKVAAGIMNTHSHSADARMEVLCSNAIRAGGDLACARSILQCNTTDEALRVLDENHILKETMKEITDRIQFYLDHRSYQQILLGAVIFSNEYGYLGQTANAAELIDKISKGEKE